MDLKIHYSSDFQNVLLGGNGVPIRTTCCKEARGKEFGAAEWVSLHSTVIPHSDKLLSIYNSTKHFFEQNVKSFVIFMGKF